MTEQELRALVSARREAIRKTQDEISVRGNRYYLSAVGDDRNDGRTPDTPWKTAERLRNADLHPGDGVFFRRGDLFRGSVPVFDGVTYAAYGTGEKPRIYGGEHDLTEQKWLRVAENIWEYPTPMRDVGTLVFNGGEAVARKKIPSWDGARFVLREDHSVPFSPLVHLTQDLDLFCEITQPQITLPDGLTVPDVTDTAVGTLWLRCDAGEPSEVFDSIEALPKGHLFPIKGHRDVTLDNLCLRFCGSHAVGAGTTRGLTVTNCEIGWIGGSVQHYRGTDPNNPACTPGDVTRYGNGVEIYGGCTDYAVQNCWIYEVYDAGITHQYTCRPGDTVVMENIRYRNDLIERCVYSIEYFLSHTEGSASVMRNVEISGNILTDCGFGWGKQRPNPETPTHIQGWSVENPAERFVIEQNIIFRSTHRLLRLNAEKTSSLPLLHGNRYGQTPGGMIGQIGIGADGQTVSLSDGKTEETLKNRFGDREAEWIK